MTITVLCCYSKCNTCVVLLQDEYHVLCCVVAGRVPPVHRGAAAVRQVVRVHVVQPAGGQAEVLQEAREADVNGGRAALQGRASGWNELKSAHNFTKLRRKLRQTIPHSQSTHLAQRELRFMYFASLKMSRPPPLTRCATVNVSATQSCRIISFYPLSRTLSRSTRVSFIAHRQKRSPCLALRR